MSGLRVAYVIGTTTGGTGRHVAMLAEGCAARGLKVSVVGPEATRSLFPGVVFAPVDLAERPRPAQDTRAVLRLRRLLRSGPDVVHAHGLRAGAAAVLAVTGVVRASRPAVLVTVHNAVPSGRLSGLVYLALERLVARRADAVLCVSEDLADRMQRAGAREVALAVVPAPAAAPPSAEAVAKVRAEIGAPGRPVVLAVGRLAPQKGFDVLLEAMGRLPDREPVPHKGIDGPLEAMGRLPGRDPAPMLVIAGDGPLAGELAARSRAAGSDVRFLGRRGDVPALLGAADVVVVPSRWEGQPLIVQEALRAGRPLIAARVGGIPALTGEDGALLVPPGDPARLALALGSVLDDPALSRRLGAAALVRATALPTESGAVEAVVDRYAKMTRESGTESA